VKGGSVTILSNGRSPLRGERPFERIVKAKSLLVVGHMGTAKTTFALGTGGASQSHVSMTFSLNSCSSVRQVDWAREAKQDRRTNVFLLGGAWNKLGVVDVITRRACRVAPVLLVFSILLLRTNSSHSQAAPDAANALRWLDVQTMGGGTCQYVGVPGPADARCAFTLIHGAEIAALSEMRAGGGKIAFASHRGGLESVFVMGDDGSDIVGIGEAGVRTAWPDWSPDGQFVVFERGEGRNVDLYVARADGSGLTQVTDDPAQEGKPDWSPDKKRIAFYSARAGTHDIFVINADGSNWVLVIGADRSDEDDPDWSPDGTRLAFRSTYDGNSEIYVVNVDGSNAVNLTRHPGNDFDPAWSPDGTQIAFMSERDGNFEIYVMNADGSNLRRLTNYRGWDARPAWSPDGSQIVYDSDRDGQWDIWAMNADGSNPRRLTNDRFEDHCAVWCAGGGKAGRRYIGPAGSDEGWDPSLGETRTVALVAHSGEGVESVLTFDLAPEAKGALACEPVSGLGDKLAGLCVSARGLNAVVEDMARGLVPRVWAPPTEGTAWLLLVLSAETGKVVSVLASPDQALVRKAKVELADGRVTLGGRFCAAQTAGYMGLNLVRDEASEIALDAETGQVVLVR
jgi:Tol biopolymer transport system component